jgi:hypothetical protein
MAPMGLSLADTAPVVCRHRGTARPSEHTAITEIGLEKISDGIDDRAGLRSRVFETSQRK